MREEIAKLKAELTALDKRIEYAKAKLDAQPIYPREGLDALMTLYRRRDVLIDAIRVAKMPDRRKKRGC